MPRKVFALLSPILLALVLSLSASADDLDHLNIEGIVTDATGALLSGVNVTARFVAVGQERAAVSDQQGRYRFSSLAPGDYELRVELSGFRSVVVSFSAVESILRQKAKR